jgi:hypothetical protein
MTRKKTPPAPIVRTIEEREKEHRDFLARVAESELERLNASIAEFAADLMKNPARALEWSQAVFERAADHAIVARLGRQLEAGTTRQSLNDWAKQEAESAANDALSTRSTSPCVNEMALMRGRAWRKWLPIIVFEISN